MPAASVIGSRSIVKRGGENFRRSRLKRREGCHTPLGSDDDGQRAGNLLRGGVVAGVRLPVLFELLDITIGAARGDDGFRRHPCSSVTHLVTKDDCGYHYDEFLPNNCAAVSASSRSHLSELRPRRIRKSFAGSRDHWTTRHQARGTYGCILSPPGPSVRSSSSRPGPETVVVPVYPAAQLSRACGEATGLHATSAGGDAPVYPGPPLARVRAHRHRAQAQRWLLCRYIRTRNCHGPAVRLLVISG